jgi:hypothetical protein
MLAILVNVYLMIGIPYDAIYRTAIWCAFGILLYFIWGIRHSKLNFATTEDNLNPEPSLLSSNSSSASPQTATITNDLIE